MGRAMAQEQPDFVLTWIGDPGDGSKVFDVNSDGVAAVQIKPMGINLERYGAVHAPGKALLNLDLLAAPHIPAG